VEVTKKKTSLFFAVVGATSEKMGDAIGGLENSIFSSVLLNSLIANERIHHF
jgi:hypothetical protein